MRFLLLIFSLTLFLVANSQQLAKKGKKVVSIYCKEELLPKDVSNLNDAILKIKNSNACEKIDNKKLEWIAHYLLNKNSHIHNSKIDVPKDAKCPVCGMFVSKYPKWAALIEHNGKKHYFDGIKDMMKYYFFDGNFPYDRAKITNMEVTNYYTLKAIKAKDAFYVYDSKVFGPMGRELIAFSTKKEANSFINDYGGVLMQFKDITPKNVMALDGVELNAK